MNTSQTENAKVYLPIMKSDIECIFESNELYTLEDAKQVLINLIKHSDEYNQLIDATKKFCNILIELDIREVFYMCQDIVDVIENWTGNESRMTQLEDFVDLAWTYIKNPQPHMRILVNDIEELVNIIEDLVYNIRNWSGKTSNFESKEHNDGTRFIIYKRGK